MMAFIMESINDAMVTLGTGVVLWLVIGLALIMYILLFEKPRDRKNPRQIFNQEILSILSQYILDNPDIRFGQALRNLGAINDVGVKDSSDPEWETPTFYIDRIILHEEPQVTLARMRRAKAGVYEDTKITKKP